MGDATKIEWSEATWNPVVGCAHVSPGCDNCYAAREASGRLRGVPIYTGLAEGGKFTGEVRLVPERLDQPLRWRRPRRIFVNSMSDLFHRDVPSDFIARVFGVMLASGRHTYQVLTKRPSRMADLLSSRTNTGEQTWWLDAMHSYRDEWREHRGADAGYPTTREWMGLARAANVWLGTSIESDSYTFRARHLSATPATVRWLSLEPLLGPLPSLNLTGIDWVVVGGESGPGARTMQLDWVDDIIARCRAAATPVFVKQLGSAYRQAGDLKGGNPDFWPPELRIREYPEVAA